MHDWSSAHTSTDGPSQKQKMCKAEKFQIEGRIHMVIESTGMYSPVISMIIRHSPDLSNKNEYKLGRL